MSITQQTTAHRALMASLARDPEATFYHLWVDQRDALEGMRNGQLSPRAAESHARTYTGLARSLYSWTSSTVESTQAHRHHAFVAAQGLETTAAALTKFAAGATAVAAAVWERWADSGEPPMATVIDSVTWQATDHG